MVLEGNADVRDWFHHGVGADDDVAMTALEQPGDHQHQRALAAAGRTDDRYELARLDLAADFPQGEERLVGFLADFLGNRAGADRAAALRVRGEFTRHPPSPPRPSPTGSP